jgi:hypothetical protein
MKKLIRKVKQILKITNVTCVIEYTDTLSMGQFSALMQNMVNKLDWDCKPSHVSGRPGSNFIEVDFEKECITEEKLIRASDMVLEGIRQPNQVKSVKINML